MATNDTTIHLLQIILEMALLEKPYPGQVQGTTFFPDREWVVDREKIIVLDRFLEGETKLEIPPYDIEVLSENQLEARAVAGGFPYFALSEVDIGAEEATLALELRWMAGGAEEDQDGVPLGGGGVRVRFEQVAGEWHAPAGAIGTWIS